MCAMNRRADPKPPEVEVVIEIPRGSFIKRGSTGHIDFVSPLPCPFNYGSVPQLIGLEGDLLDAVVLGPRLPRGTRTRVKAWGAVTLTDRGMSDDKLICSAHPLGSSTSGVGALAGTRVKDGARRAQPSRVPDREMPTGADRPFGSDRPVPSDVGASPPPSGQIGAVKKRDTNCQLL